jgi:hypothetical protein
MVLRKLDAAVRWEFTPLFVLVLLNLTIGVVISPDYGIGIDEAGDVQYDIDALGSYLSNERNWEGYGTRKYYGPAYLMTQEWLTSHLSKIFPTRSAIGIRHFIIYAVFQVAIVSLYLFLRRSFSRLTTLTVSLLFALQPLFFGHAFINGKDIPFLSMFLLTMVLGITASDRLVRALRSRETDSSYLYRKLLTAIREDW